MTASRRRCLVLAVVLAAVGPGCGGEGTTFSNPAPSPPSPAGLAGGSALTVVSGLDDSPVPGATITIAGRAYVTDGEGRLVTDERALLGALIDVAAPAFLERQTLLRSGPLTRVALWPRTTPAGVDENFTARIVYTSAGIDGPGPVGGEPLRRLPRDGELVVVVPSAELLDDPPAHDFLVQAVARITEATGGAVRYALARERPPTGIVFEARVDPAESLCAQRARAFVRWTLRGNVEITGGTVVFCSLDNARTGTAVHEMGHTFGLLHSVDPRDVMFGGFAARRSVGFGQRESDVMKLMLERRAGNRYPDSDRGVSGASDGADVIVCP